MKKRTASKILRYRFPLLSAILVLTIFMGYMATKVEMSYNYSLLLPENDVVSKNYRAFKDRFGVEGNIIFLAVQDSSFFTLDKTKNWLAFGDSLLQINGINTIISFAHNTFNIKKNTAEKKFELEPIFPSSLSSQQELDSVMDIVTKLPFYQGYLYNKDKNVYLMLLLVKKEILTNPAREELVNKIVEKADIYSKKNDHHVHFSGLPYIRVTTAMMLKKEMLLFIILSLVITIIILFLFFKSFRITLVCTLVVVVAVIWALGFMAIFNYKITQLTTLLPPLLVVLGIPNCIFLINKYHNEYLIHGNKFEALQTIIQKIGYAIFLTNITTAAGFITLVFTSSTILREFGIIAALNIMVLFILSLLIISIVFSYQPVPKSRHTKHLKNRFIKKITHSIGVLVENYRPPIYILSIILIILSIIGILKIKTTGFMVDDLPQDNMILQDLHFFQDNFKGVMPLEIIVDSKKKNGVFELSVLKKIEALDKKVSLFNEISPSVSIVNMIKFINQAYYNGNPKFYKLPTNQTKNFIFSYALKSKDKIKLEEMYSFIDSAKQRARVSFYMKDIGNKKMVTLKKKIIPIIDSIFPPIKYDITITGSSVVYYKGTSYLFKNLIVSLAIAIFLIAVFMAWMFSSKKMVLISLIPNIIPLIITAALMGFFGIPIKASTILIFAISFGISVDYTIHYLAHYRQALGENKWKIKPSVFNALKEAGQSMIYTSVILFFGFGIFSISQFGGTVSLGRLVSFTLLSSVFSNLILLPAFLLTLEKRILQKSFKEPTIEIKI